MSNDIKELVKRLRDMLPQSVGPKAADALEALAGEVERLNGLREDNAAMYRKMVEQYHAAAAERDRMKAALVRLRDCDWVIRLPDRMDGVRQIARKALEAKE